MEKFTTLTSLAAPLPEASIDTDIIFPARFLLLLNKKGLGEQLFHERRLDHEPDGPRFILDTPPFDKAQILVTGRNFGTGSSREQAVWALADFGFRCVIAPSFGEIFFANCFKNGVLPIVLGETDCEAVMARANAQAPITIDLDAQTVDIGNGKAIQFQVDAHGKRSLLLGLDEIGLTLADDASDIADFEARQRQTQPWCYLKERQRDVFSDLKDELR